MTPGDYSEGAEPPEPASRGADDADPSDGAGVIVLAARDGAGERLDRFLARALAGRVEGLSRSRVQKWIALGAVGCAERTLSSSTRLSGVETITVEPLPREADRSFEPDPVELEIVEEDDRLLVIDKPAGLVVHPAAGHWRDTLLNGLLYHRPALGELPRAGIVHRLDKDTSGLMVVAKTEAAVAALVGQLAARSMSRRYFAFVAGLAPRHAEVDAAIGRDPRSRVRMAVVEGPSGKPARTFVERIATLAVDRVRASLVECRLESGRTHQIRVHMAHLGHPLLGDTVYGGPAAGISRQALHAWRLGLADPLDARARHWVRPPPTDMCALAQSAGLDFEKICDDIDRRIRD